MTRPIENIRAEFDDTMNLITEMKNKEYTGINVTLEERDSDGKLKGLVDRYAHIDRKLLIKALGARLEELGEQIQNGGR